MSFSVEVLKELAASRVSKLPGDVFTFYLVDPLMRRIVTRKLEPHRVQELVNLTFTYFRKHPDSAVHMSLLRGSLPFTVTGYWSASTNLFEDQHVALLRLRQDDLYKSFSVYQSILNAAQQPKRYRLLQLIFLYSKGLEVDIDTDEGLAKLPLGRWPSSLFLTLQREHAVALLLRLSRVKPEDSFLEVQGDRITILSQRPTPDSSYGGPRLLLLLLREGSEAGLKAAEGAVEELKTKALRSREQTDRAFYAKSASLYAIASGSLELYGDTVSWLRRFVRDPKTVKDHLRQRRYQYRSRDRIALRHSSKSRRNNNCQHS